MKDETFKMILQYDNAVVWTGLGLYGNFLTGISIVGLILSFLIPATGKSWGGRGELGVEGELRNSKGKFLGVVQVDLVNNQYLVI